MKFSWVLPDNNSLNKFEDEETFLNKNIEEAKLAERNGFDSILVSSTPNSFDPWILATYLAMKTERIKLIVAQNTSHVLPSSTLKALNTLNYITNNRIDINVVTGSSKEGILKDTKYLNHEIRYKRTYEFLELLQKLRKGICSHEGEFFQVNNATIYPKIRGEDSSSIFVAGSSNEALAAAAKFGDYHLSYADDFPNVGEQISRLNNLSQRYSRSVKSGIYINIISRKTTNEAWNEAYKLIERASPFQKRLVKLYYSNADSIGILKHNAFNKEFSNKALWGGLASISTTVSLSIIGSYGEVADTLKKYQELGVSFFLLLSASNDKEIERIGNYVLPYLKM